MPTEEEVKHGAFKWNKESAGGPDDFNGCFFQSSWEIIGDDVHAMVRDFFLWQELPKIISHTNLVLLPKKKKLQCFQI